jgi:hypothetical protein
MSKKDLGMIVGVIVVAIIFSIVISNVAFGSYKQHVIKVPVVQPISADFPSPQTDNDYKAFFNSNAINPTQLIKIGGQPNNTPFNDTEGQ